MENKRQSHGVLDEGTITDWSIKTQALINDCLKVFGAIIPIRDEDNSLRLSKSYGNLNIKSLKARQDHAIVILRIAAKRGVWKLKGQLLSLKNAEEFTIDLPEDNIFSIENLRPLEKYKLAEILSKNKSYSFFHNIPIRQTNTFEGRTEELDTLLEWMDDEDSRHCLVFGDGGYGKTTLVIEMLNQCLENQHDFNKPFPEIISYHTAKMTKWNEKGLVHFTSMAPVMDECIRELIRLIYPVLPVGWYTTSGKALIDKAVGVLRENKYTRDDVLLIMDNTETLAKEFGEGKALGAFFKSVGKLVGRLIITSRRREFIEATPIHVEGLSELESIRLMKRVAEEYNAIPILQAGEPKLRKISNQLMRKPLLLEALVKYIAHSKVGIDAALDNVFKKSNDELLEFLYEDAWIRINQLQKEVFLVMIHLTCPLDQYSISQTCLEIGIQHSEFQAGLTETHFAISTDLGRIYEIELVDLAKRFFLQQFAKLRFSKKERLKEIALNVDAYALKRAKIDNDYISDRVAEAFRSEYAKAAKIYVDKNEITNAIEMYELAIEDDPLNSALHDRFAWLLFNKTSNFEYAKQMAKKAIALDPKNCDAIVNLALIYYRLENLSKGDEYIDIAKENGRTTSFCLLRKSIARYHQSMSEIDLNKAISMLEKALENLTIAERQKDKLDRYYSKNLKDIDKYRGLTVKRMAALKTKRTKTLASVR